MQRVQQLIVLGVCAAASTILVSGAAHAQQAQPGVPQEFGFGRAPSPDEINAWNIDVLPDGTGLPEGSGSVERGAAIYAEKCAACHGETGREGPLDRLVEPAASDFAFGRDPSLVRTVGNYWPYATTVYDFINRAMPLPEPGSLEPDEVYSLVAWILHQNDILPADATLDAASLPQVVMPARDRFVRDNRRGGAEIR
jgi:mono/diheme cytochrome c family protein